MESVIGKLLVILNASAGSGCDDDSAQSFIAKFAAHGITATVTLAKNGSELIGAAKQAVKDGTPMVAAGGGDGTQNAVASELIGTDTLYGVLPMGTLNHFAKDLGFRSTWMRPSHPWWLEPPHNSAAHYPFASLSA